MLLGGGTKASPWASCHRLDSRAGVARLGNALAEEPWALEVGWGDLVGLGTSTRPLPLL